MSGKKTVEKNSHRKKHRIRQRYIRVCINCTVAALFVGMIVGFWCGYVVFKDTELYSSVNQNGFSATDIKSSINHSVNPSVVDSYGLPWGTKDNPFKIGDIYSIMSDTDADGEAHTDSALSPVVTQNISVVLTDFFDPEYYNRLYSSDYRLTGTEAPAVLSISSDKPINPQTAITLNIETAHGVVLNSYPLIDKAISGESVTSIDAGQMYTVYKRFQYDPNSAAFYLTLTHHHDGQAIKAYFLLEPFFETQVESMQD